MSKVSYHDLMKQALANDLPPIQSVTISHAPTIGPSQYPFEGEQYVFVNPCTECKKPNPKPGHNCWKYS